MSWKCESCYEYAVELQNGKCHNCFNKPKSYMPSHHEEKVKRNLIAVSGEYNHIVICDDGSMWKWTYDSEDYEKANKGWSWTRLPDIPQDEEE